jgi:hypothetical protein
MNSSVRLIKRGGNDRLKSVRANQSEKAGPQATREIVSTVKGWIAELKQRQRGDDRRYAAFIK